MTELQNRLFAMQDETYRQFMQKLLPTVDLERIIGIRTPQLRQFSKEFAREPQAMTFLTQLPHTYYEEDNLHAYLVAAMKDFEQVMAYTEEFLPYIDNWATCDVFSPKVFQKYPEQLYPRLLSWMTSERTYTVRFGIVRLMEYYLNEQFQPEMLERVAAIHTDEYYINMAVAWYFSIALIKQAEATLPYIEQHLLDRWVHNKTIQKAVESYRIEDSMKTYLKSLRRK